MTWRIVHATSDWFRARRPNPATLKVASAFAGGVVFTAAITISWLTAWTAMSDPPVSAMHAAAAAPQGQEAQQAHPIQQVTPQAGCDKQAWPYVEERCRPLRQTAAEPIRVIGPDKPSAPSAAEARPAAAPPDGNAVASTATREAATTGDGMPAKPTSATKDQHAAAIAARLTAGLSLSPTPVPSQEPATTASSNTAASSNLNRPAEQSPVSRRRAGTARENIRTAQERRRYRDRSGNIYAYAPESRDGNAAPTGRSSVEADDDDRDTTPGRYLDPERGRTAIRDGSRDVTQGRRRGHRITVERTLTMADGRTVTLTRIYRSAAEAARYERTAQPYRRPYAGYRMVPSATEDDGD